MKPEKQKIAIAEVCGWSDCQYIEGLGACKGIPPKNYSGYLNRYENCYAEIPNYLSDLNLMHEAEKKVGFHSDKEGKVSPSSHTYWRFLLEVCKKVGNNIHCASAKQRAEAFLKALGRWIDND